MPFSPLPEPLADAPLSLERAAVVGLYTFWCWRAHERGTGELLVEDLLDLSAGDEEVASARLSAMTEYGLVERDGTRWRPAFQVPYPF